MNTQCRKRRRQLHEERRQASARDYAEAATKAALADLCLVKHTSAHYSLRCQYPYEARWLMDLYPSSQRIYAIARPPAWPHRPPKLAVPLNWTVLDVMLAAIAEVSNG